MRIEHLALWTRDLEAMRVFYEQYFGAVAGERYHNPRKRFTSYFLSFSGGARLELMQRDDVTADNRIERLGYAHFALATGSRDRVDALTETLRAAGIRVAGEPRTTGDGYYESVVLDPEGNRIEITV